MRPHKRDYRRPQLQHHASRKTHSKHQTRTIPHPPDSHPPLSSHPTSPTSPTATTPKTPLPNPMTNPCSPPLPSLGFLNSTWRNTLLIGTLTYLAYTFLPSPPSSPTSPSSNPGYNDPSSDSMPLLSRVMARGTTPAEEWKRRNARHLEQTVRSAEDRLLFQEAERPRVYRLKNPA